MGDKESKSDEGAGAGASEAVVNPDWVNAGPENRLVFMIEAGAFDVIQIGPTPATAPAQLKTIQDK